MIRIGFGYDVHRLKEGRKLIIGGVNIPYDRGLDGHSDADVLVHAINDAILGALGKGDIGMHFPDTDQKYKDIYSVLMTHEVVRIMDEEGYEVNNLDCTIAAEKPKLSPYLPEMKRILSEALRTTEDRINIKATTTEGLGYIGREEGIAAYAVLTLIKMGS